MYILAIGWLYVALMAAVAEGTNPNGSLLGAIVTFACYGLMPVGLLIYLLGRPARRRRHEGQADGTSRSVDSAAPDAGRHAAGAAEPRGVAPMRKED